MNHYIVFSDVDETLIKFKSMIVFMEYFLNETEYADSSAAAAKRREFETINHLNTGTADRVALNTRFYKMFSGIAQQELRNAAAVWLRQVMERGDLFVPSTYHEQCAHRQAGAEIVLVSGSFHDILGPVQERVGADALLCSNIEVEDGVYTGRLIQQVIGNGKWTAIASYLDGRTIDLEHCYAYGDHVSDICFMEKVGHPVVVGNSPSMLEIARGRGWRVLPAD